MKTHHFALVLVLMGCGGAIANREAVAPGDQLTCPAGTANGGATIITMDCNTVVQYEGNEFEASLEMGDWVKAGLHNAPRVLRDIDKAATDSQLQFTQTCRVYNSCQMRSAEFNQALTAAQEQFRKLREKVALLEASGGNPAVLRETLASVYEATVSAPLRADRALVASLVVQAKDPADAPPRIVREGDVLHTGAKIVVGVEVNQDAHVYVFQRHQDGALDILFPNGALQDLRNPIRAGSVVRIPPEGHVFTLNDEDLGDERIYVVASLRPLVDLEAALSSPSRQAQDANAVPPTPVVESAMTSLFEEGNPSCAGRHRGLEVTPDDGCSSMTRGLTLTPSQGADSFDSHRVSSAPGDDIVLQTFGFRHVQ